MRYILMIAIYLAAPAHTAAADFAELCANNFNTAPGLCECMAGKFETDMDDDQRRFVIASIEQDTAVTEELRQSLPFDKLTVAAMFLVNAPQECANGQ